MWVAEFKRVCTWIQDVKRPGTSQSATTVTIEKVYNVVLIDRQIKMQKLEYIVKISDKWVLYVYT